MGSDPSSKPASYKIADLVIDEGSRRVMRNGETLKLGGLTFDLLLALIECAPNIAFHDELAERVWKGRPVSSETIAQRAKMLRDALSDDAKNPRYFEPVRGQGYRWRSSVEPIVTDIPERPKRTGLTLGFFGLAAIVAIALTAVWLRPDDRLQNSIAVLPFENLSPREEDAIFAIGLYEETLNQFNNIGGLNVIGDMAMRRNSDTDEQLTDIAEEWNVETVMQASVRYEDDRIRVVAKLIDGRTGLHRWSEIYDEDFDNIFSIQESIARQVAGALGVQLGVGGANAFRGAGTDDVEAYKLYLRSLQDMGIPERIALLQRVVDMDPNYAAAWAELGLAIVSQKWTVLPDKSMGFADEGLTYVRRALELEPDDARVHSILGTVHYARNEWREGQAAHDTAISLSPRTEILSQSGALYVRSGRSSVAVERLESAEANNDLRNMFATRMKIHALLALGRFDEVRGLLPTLDEIELPEFTLLLRLSDGTVEEVRAALMAQVGPPAALARLYRPVLEVFDDHDAAFALLHDLDADPIEWPSKWHDISRLAAWYGDAEFALELAGRGARYASPRRYALWLPFMAEARQLPAFKELVSDIGLVEYWREYGWGDFCQPIGDTDFACS